MVKRIVKCKQKRTVKFKLEDIKAAGFGVNLEGEDGDLISTQVHGNCLLCWQGDQAGFSFIVCVTPYT